MLARHAGRHRAPGYSPITEIADIASRTAQPAMKASAVAVASGGLIASFAIPASAASSAQSAPAASSTAAAPAAAPAVAVAAPKVAAAKTPTFGVVGFAATAAPVAAPTTIKITKIKKADPAPTTTRTTTRASRSTTRTTTAAPAAAPAQETAPAAAPAPAPVGGILGIAASLSGIPYVYGGSSPSGFDCSGFTSYVYRQAGISIPRTSQAQQAAATRVSNPAPGDLIFFGSPAYHVGIYAGPGVMYDAQHPGTTTGLHSIWTSSGVSYGRIG